MTEALLDVRDLTKAYGGLKASDHLSFQLDAGEIHAVIGPNGAGKTTFIAQIMGDVRPDQGMINFAGQFQVFYRHFNGCHSLILLFKFYCAAGGTMKLIKSWSGRSE